MGLCLESPWRRWLRFTSRFGCSSVEHRRRPLRWQFWRSRRAALAKAANRIAATLIGATMSVVIAGLFPGEQIGMLGAFVCWICVCVFVASYLRGYHAYAAISSGYTVAIIALVHIDTQQNAFTTMTARMAAIAIGILCVTLISDVFGSPPVWSGLDGGINDIWRDVRSYARDV
jgi:uncharacterized membrane protein YccC